LNEFRNDAARNETVVSNSLDSVVEARGRDSFRGVGQDEIVMEKSYKVKVQRAGNERELNAGSSV